MANSSERGSALAAALLPAWWNNDALLPLAIDIAATTAPEIKLTGDLALSFDALSPLAQELVQGWQLASLSSNA